MLRSKTFSSRIMDSALKSNRCPEDTVMPMMGTTPFHWATILPCRGLPLKSRRDNVALRAGKYDSHGGSSNDGGRVRFAKVAPIDTVLSLSLYVPRILKGVNPSKDAVPLRDFVLEKKTIHYQITNLEIQARRILVTDCS